MSQSPDTSTASAEDLKTADDARGIENILVVGSGAMGRQIGMLAAQAGFSATVHDVSSEAVSKAEQQMRAWLDGRVQKGRISPNEAEGILGRIRFTDVLEEGAGTADLVIEAATEALQTKRRIFAQLDGLTPADTILVTNSSTYGSSHVADATHRPEKVCNMHFFNPALVMKCVEVVRHEETSDATVRTVVAVARRMGKVPVLLRHEIPGFIANRLMGAVRAEALSLYDQGVASVEDIDSAAKNALGYPMGPFELMDLVGIDVTYDIRQAVYELTGDEDERPHRLIEELYRAGKLGRKTNEGWYRYDDDGRPQC